MKLVITESQAISIIEKLEDSPDIDINAIAPDLAKLASKLSNPLGTIAAPAIDNTTEKLKQTKVGNYLSNLFGSSDEEKIDPNEMLHPLNRKGTITSHFGKRKAPVTRDGKRGSTTHGGIDFAVPTGTPVYSPLNGRVVFAGDSTPNACGGHVKIRHSRSLETKYCHLSRWTVKKGDKVKKGDVIGYTGGGSRDRYKGTSTDPHLHYEIVVDGESVNPITVQKNLKV